MATDRSNDSTPARLRLVLASNNTKKLAELQTLFAPLAIELVSQASLGVAEAEEPFATFIENALVKARHAARRSGSAAIADDSGLCVDALGGEPGVQSAVFADLDTAAVRHGGKMAGIRTGSDTATAVVNVTAGADVSPALSEREAQRRRQDSANNALLLSRLGGHADRRARFVCTLVAVRHADDPEPLVAVGRWDAEILEEPRGSNGFGYDPLVLIPALGMSVAELGADIKNAQSHRARAAASMLAQMRDAWRLT